MSTAPGITRTYTYDSFSRPSTVQHTISGTNYIEQTSYDSSSRVRITVVEGNLASIGSR